MLMTVVFGVTGVKMAFTHDTEAALASAAALVNTLGTVDGIDRLTDLAALDEFVTTHRWAGRRARTRAELRAVQALRPRLRRLWEVSEEDLVVLINTMLREANAVPRLVRHDEWDYHLHATPDDAPLAQRMLIEAAMAFVDVIRSRELDRMRICDAADCGNVVVDLSKNRSKRFCDNGCGNRAAVSAYRARKAAAR
jgi:predicted RNA-binding Zn ribbon-like protein